MEFKERIKEKRIELKLTQEEVAEKIYVSRQTISNWETGKTIPDINSLILLSDCYSISLDELIKGDKKMVEKIDNQLKVGKKLKKVLIAVTALIILVIIVVPTYKTLWNKKAKNQYNNFENSIEWDGKHTEGYYIQEGDLKFIGVNYLTTDYPSPFFKPFQVRVYDGDLRLMTNDMETYTIWNKKEGNSGLSVEVDKDGELIPNREWSKNELKFYKNNKNKALELIPKLDEFFKKVNK